MASLLERPDLPNVREHPKLDAEQEERHDATDNETAQYFVVVHGVSVWTDEQANSSMALSTVRARPRYFRLMLW